MSIVHQRQHVDKQEQITQMIMIGLIIEHVFNVHHQRVVVHQHVRTQVQTIESYPYDIHQLIDIYLK